MNKKNETRTELGTLGEFGLINRIKETVKLNQESSKLGIGDDAAIINFGDNSDTLISTDMLVEGIHFDLSFMPLKHLGYKSVVVNLSDIYAMGGTPTQITVSLALSNRYSVEAIDEFYAGVKQACSYYKVDLVGGDTTSSLKGLIISVSAVGKVAKDQAILRSGAKEGDVICVSGNLGGAYIGLQILNREKQVYMAAPDSQPELTEHEYVVGRQLKPEARKDIMQLLKELNVVPSAMIDVSDGLSSELMHVCKQSDTGCIIYEANVPIHADTYNQSLEFNIDPITCAMNGGEDYELLFTINPKDESKIDFDGTDISIIGKITKADEGCKLQSRANHIHDIMAQGWNALKKA